MPYVVQSELLAFRLASVFCLSPQSSDSSELGSFARSSTSATLMVEPAGAVKVCDGVYPYAVATSVAEVS